MKPFAFVVGSGRSGTTLLRAMLDSHPEMAIPGETYLVEQLLRRSDQFLGEGLFQRSAFERELFADSRFWNFYVSETDVRDGLDRDQPTCLTDAIRSVYRTHALLAGKSRWADKTPNYAGCVLALADAFDEAVFIHLHRDPREVVNSYRKVQWRRYSIGFAAAHWRVNVEGSERGGSLGSDRFLRVGYRELVNDREATLRAVSDFVGLDFRPEMLDFNDGRVAKIESSASVAHQNLTRANPIQSSWSEELTPRQVYRIEAIAGRHLVDLGYEPVSKGSALWWVSAAMERAFWLAVARVELDVRAWRVVNRFRPVFRRMAGRADAPISAQAMSQAN